jgi:APA family basic amino acid/polyamine antiporter
VDGDCGALLLCLSTAVCYAEMAKLYPGTGSSYYFAEQAFLNREKAWKYARISKFIVGWASHLYYWIYPGVMVGPWASSVRLPGGDALAELHERLESRHVVHDGGGGGVLLRDRVHRASRHQQFDGGQLAINIIQITALLIFSVLALKLSRDHPPGSVAYQFDSTSGEAYTYEFKTTTTVVAGVSTDTIVRDANGVPLPKLDAAGKPCRSTSAIREHDASGNFLAHPNAKSVVSRTTGAGSSFRPRWRF